MFNVMTFDIEEWFSYFSDQTLKDRYWKKDQMRAHVIIDSLLDMLDERGVKATFFILGWFAKNDPETVKKIARRGHRLGYHTMDHIKLFELTKDEFRADLEYGKKLIEDMTGSAVESFRAPNFSIKEENIGHLEALVEAGYKYDSSIFPALRFDGGIPDFPVLPAKIRTNSGDLLEFPLSVYSVFSHNIQLFGGGYFRLFPDFIVEHGIKSLHRKGVPCIFYFHPYDFDHEEPRYPYKPLMKFRRYVGRKGLLDRVARLIGRWEWKNMEEFLDSAQYEEEPIRVFGVEVYPVKLEGGKA